MKRTIFPVVLIAMLALALGACTPESLEGVDPANSGTNNNTNNSTTGNNGGVTFTAEYLAVHGIVTGKCTLPGCHGPSSAGGNFLVPAGTNAQPAELQTALQDTVANSGDLLIDPGNAGTSDMYNRLLAAPPLLMPTTGALPQGEIDTIRDWIDGGATYTQ